jgi:MYXO-CTERM domain-containing protein
MFTTGTATDGADPSFAGVVGLSWDLERAPDDCVDGLVERFVFDVTLAPASDDGGTSGLTLMLFQTMGPQVMNMPTPIPARAWPRGSNAADAAMPDPSQPVHTQVKLAKDVSLGEICFAAIVRDTVGHISASNNATACVHTTAPPFFNGCSVAASGAGGLPAALVLLAVATRRRRPRARARARARW